MKKQLPKNTLVRIVSENTHEWVTVDGKKKRFDCDYNGAIKKGYGMTRKQATELVDQLARVVTKEKITAIVIFYRDPRLK